MKILIRATNWIGDAVLSLPAIRAVRGRFPDAELCVLARPWVAAVYEGEQAVDRILDALWEMLSGVCRRHAIACA